MSDEVPRRSGRWGAIFVAFVVGGSAVGVIGWYVLTNRAGPVIDATGFDMDKAPQTQQRAAPALPDAAPEPASSLGMMKADAGIRIGASDGPLPPSAKQKGRKADVRANFTDAARKHEADVRNFTMRMDRKFPILRQYARDWMSHPDLKKLNDDYMRNHDPIAFIAGLTKAPSLGTMVKQYAGNPAIVGYITEGIKEAPADLSAAALDVLSNDSVAKNLVSNVARGLGLPPSVTGLINSGGDMSKVDQNKIMSDIVNSPAAQDSMKQQ